MDTGANMDQPYKWVRDLDFSLAVNGGYRIESTPTNTEGNSTAAPEGGLGEAAMVDGDI